MASRTLSLHYGKQMHHMIETKCLISRFHCCQTLGSVIFPEKTEIVLVWKVKKNNFRNMFAVSERGFETVKYFPVFTSGSLTHRYLQTSREFHLASISSVSDPVCKKLGITNELDVDQSKAGESKLSHQNVHDDVTGCYGNSVSAVSVSTEQGRKPDEVQDKDTDTSSSTTVVPTDTTDNIGFTDDEIELKDMDSIIPLPQKPKSKILPVHNLAALADKSETLSRLVKLGVNLSEVEKVDGAADLIVKSDFEKDIRPYLLFLHDVGLEESELGHYLTKNPLIFEKDIEHLKTKVDYLVSKRFSQDSVARIVSKSYVFLLLPLSMIDAKLGFLQRQFHLTGDEVRNVISRQPKLISWKTDRLKDTIFYIKEFLGFTDSEMKKLLIAQPKVYLTNKFSLGKKFDYLHNVMGMDHDRLVQWPNIFRTRLHLLQQRHQYLLSIGRAQYNPEKENYVSLKALVSGKDAEFCQNVAKTSLTHYNNFLKTL